MNTKERQESYLKALKLLGAGKGRQEQAAARSGIPLGTVDSWRSSDSSFKKTEQALILSLEEGASDTETFIPGLAQQWLERYKTDLDRVDAAANVGLTWKKVQEWIEEYPAFKLAYQEVQKEIFTRMIDKLGKHGLENAHPASLEKYLKHELGSRSVGPVEVSDSATLGGAQEQHPWAVSILTEEVH